MLAEAKADSELLMQDLLPLAKRMLAEYGEFYPYGGFMSHDDEIVHIGAKIEETDHPDSASLIEVITQDFKLLASTQKVKATVIIFDVKIVPPHESEKTEAIQINLDHIDEYSAQVFLPYLIKENQLVLGKIFAQSGANNIFGNPSK